MNNFLIARRSLLSRDTLRAVLRHWDSLLAKVPDGRRAGLLDALEDLVEAGSPSPLLPAALRRGVGR